MILFCIGLSNPFLLSRTCFAVASCFGICLVRKGPRVLRQYAFVLGYDIRWEQHGCLNPQASLQRVNWPCLDEVKTRLVQWHLVEVVQDLSDAHHGVLPWRWGMCTKHSRFQQNLVCCKRLISLRFWNTPDASMPRDLARPTSDVRQ